MKLVNETYTDHGKTKQIDEILFSMRNGDAGSSSNSRARF